MYTYSLIFLCTFLELHCLVLGIENNRDTFFKKVVSDQKACIFITNQTGTTQSGERSIDVLLKNNVKIAYIAAPEHGLSGVIQAGADVHNHIDAKTNIPVISLYKNGSGLLIDPILLQQCDKILFDIQDCGMRHYTFVSTLYKALQLGISHDKQIVIFDRPNFLGPIISGPLVDLSLISFISIASIPLRYGLTIGELAHYFNRFCFDSKADVYVVSMRDYNPQKTQSFKNFTHLSPNIATIQACYGYSFLGILGEVRPFDIGISTDQSFRLLMLPKSLNITSKQWDALQSLLQKFHIRSQKYSYYSERKKMEMEGLSLFIHDIAKISNFMIILEILQWAFKSSIELKFSDGFDKAIGTNKVRNLYKKNDFNALNVLADTVRKDCIRFFNNAQSCLLYNQKLTIR